MHPFPSYGNDITTALPGIFAASTDIQVLRGRFAEVTGELQESSSLIATPGNHGDIQGNQLQVSA